MFWSITVNASLSLHRNMRMVWVKFRRCVFDTKRESVCVLGKVEENLFHTNTRDDRR